MAMLNAPTLSSPPSPGPDARLERIVSRERTSRLVDRFDSHESWGVKAKIEQMTKDHEGQ
jgi:hypothetical protein